MHRGAHDAKRVWHDGLRPLIANEWQFTLDGTQYRYARSRHHPTWKAERTVELAVVQAAIAGHDRVMEVGNVLAGYGVERHVVVDKYDTSTAVVNQDIVDYEGGPFDLIVSISTIEHVGWDERPRDPSKAAQALDHMLSLLDPSGEMLVTIPVGYHRDLDDEIAASRWDCAVSYLLRTGERAWKQADAELALSTTYGWPRVGANAVAFLRWGTAAARGAV